LFFENSDSIKSAALSIPAVNVLRPCISSAESIFSILSTSVTLIILSIFCEKENRNTKNAGIDKNIFFIVIF
jgi:hypothetical protein